MRWLIGIAAVMALFWMFDSGAQAAVRAPVPVVRTQVAPPTSPCENADHVGNLEIIEGVWFECVCEKRIYTPDTCDWYEITSPAVDPTQLRKWKRAHPGAVVRVRSWAKPRPKLVGGKVVAT